MAFPGGLDAGYERKIGIRNDFMVWSLSKKNGGLFSEMRKLLRDGN